ncbi:alpha/beta hydrolase fold domain-containing protein [Cellulomonas citrea]|uniref:alpha/beta hydrolase fold domain-containing protein n=1 Tax=Cellulomonas citrea TaxID=1909423 RepID=UPI0019157C1A|nr:alpha/beta hydrolase fold domain-containing protein [Cellulomonas citrea]
MDTLTTLPVLYRINDQMRAVLATSAELAPDAYATDAGTDQMRQAYTLERRYWNEGGPAMVRTLDASVRTPHGDVTTRWHVPHEGVDLPVVVYIHGGGWVVGNLETHDRIMRALAHESGAAVLGVDYSLSPEAKFPVAVEQCAAVVAALLGGAPGGLPIDTGRIAIAGDSGGANMALAVALLLRDRAAAGERVVPLAGLALYYGLYGLRDSASRRLLGGPWDGLSEADLAYYLDCYLADPADERSPYVDCLAADLSDVPPCYLASADLDPLRDDTTALAQLLAARGVRVEQDVFTGVLHGFLHYSRMLDDAVVALRHGGDFLRRTFETTH